MEALREVLTSAVPDSVNPVVLASETELRCGSLVMMFTTPAIAFDPYRAEPPPRITSTRSTMPAGSCSRP